MGGRLPLLPLTFTVVDEPGDYVVSLPRPVVPPTADGHPWTKITVEEGDAYEPEQWTALVDAASISDLDSFAESPRGRRITVSGTRLERGWYRLTWINAAGFKLVEGPIPYGRDRYPAAPTLAQVAKYVRVRVKDEDDNTRPEFDDDTSITAAEVEALIETVRQEVAGKILVQIPVDQAANAAEVVALGVASYLDPSFHPESVADGDSSFSTLRALYLARVGELETACRNSDYPLIR